MRHLPRVAAGGLATAAMLMLPVAALAQGGGGGPAPFHLKLKVDGVRNGKVDVGDRVTVIGKVRPFVGGQRVEVRLANGGDVVEKWDPFVREVKGRGFGRFKVRSKPLAEAGKYRARASKASTGRQDGGRAKSREFRLDFPDLDPGQSGRDVALFNDLLRRAGYYAPNGDTYSSGTGRAVLAFRKVNGMARTSQATAGIFAKLAAGKGRFKLRHPEAGKHVEVDISRQVMALADDGRAKYVFHVSTGAPATPSDRGHFSFYRKDPGFNSLGMYYSVYYNGGEATHGYKSVPTYPASHGCIRNPIPDSVFIYNWIDLGDSMYVYD